MGSRGNRRAERERLLALLACPPPLPLPAPPGLLAGDGRQSEEGAVEEEEEAALRSAVIALSRLMQGEEKGEEGGEAEGGGPGHRSLPHPAPLYRRLLPQLLPPPLSPYSAGGAGPASSSCVSASSLPSSALFLLLRRSVDCGGWSVSSSTFPSVLSLLSCAAAGEEEERASAVSVVAHLLTQLTHSTQPSQVSASSTDCPRALHLTPPFSYRCCGRSAVQCSRARKPLEQRRWQSPHTPAQPHLHTQPMRRVAHTQRTQPPLHWQRWRVEREGGGVDEAAATAAALQHRRRAGAVPAAGCAHPAPPYCSSSATASPAHHQTSRRCPPLPLLHPVLSLGLPSCRPLTGPRCCLSCSTAWTTPTTECAWRLCRRCSRPCSCRSRWPLPSTSSTPPPRSRATGRTASHYTRSLTSPPTPPPPLPQPSSQPSTPLCAPSRDAARRRCRQPLKRQRTPARRRPRSPAIAHSQRTASTDLIALHPC